MELKFARIRQLCAVPTIQIYEAMTTLESAGWPRKKPDTRELPSPGNSFKRVMRYSRWAPLCLSIFIIVTASRALGVDDNENNTPTAWWIYTGQTFDDVQNTIKNLSTRIIDIDVNNSNPNLFTVTYVQNTGSYGKQWWWYVGIDSQTLAKNLSTNNARLISLKAYDIGGGNIRFAVAMISNTGADGKAWWYYFGKSPTDISNLTKSNNARLTALQSYTSNGQTWYACIMIANRGPDAKGWWWYFNANSQTISNAISSDNARVLDLTSAGNGNFNVVMESCSGGCPAWWWYYGLNANGVVTTALDNGARVLTADTYQGCGSADPCFAAVMISNTPADITACDPQGCISEAKLSANICGTLANHVVGYSCLVGGLRPGFGGQARTSTNPPSTPMTPDLVTDIASVSKTMTATGVLQMLAKAGLTIDTKISPYIYPDWTRGPNINQITFKELLTHSSGFGQTPICGSNIDYAGLKTVVANGVTAANIGVPSYGNCNFALLRELMPAVSGQSLTSFPDGPLRAQQSSTLYINYMNAHVFQPVGVPASECKPPAGTNDVLSYTNPAGTTSGTDWGDWSLQCGSGGWMLSANNIFSVINDLANGNTLLTNSEKQQMFSNCLGWDCAVRSDCPTPYVCKNGDLNNGAGTAVWTYAGIFKCNVPVVVVVNSPLPSPYQTSNDIIGLVENAYKGAAVAGTPRACP